MHISLFSNIFFRQVSALKSLLKHHEEIPKLSPSNASKSCGTAPESGCSLQEGRDHISPIPKSTKNIV